MSDLVGNPEDRFSHNEALMTSVGEEKADRSAMERCFVVSVSRDFLFPFVNVGGFVTLTSLDHRVHMHELI